MKGLKKDNRMVQSIMFQDTSKKFGIVFINNIYLKV